MSIYQKIPYAAPKTEAVLYSDRMCTTPLAIPRNLPGTIIVVHGVNDVGCSFSAVEEGLCQGLEQRLGRYFKPAPYTLPTSADSERLIDDPDAKFYKRKSTEETNSPVIPFYWGFRELDNMVKKVNGQETDRYGNRLDKDRSKGGGPFANATSTLPDMWNKGTGAPADVIRDPLRPLFAAPGRMYMILAAQRLAALISMIRDYDPGDTVSIVGHSQGCLLTLLAQALLAERGLRPADTLILTHPPYSLVEDLPWYLDAADKLHGGEDAAMAPYYSSIKGGQSLHGRLQTLVNIVRKVVDQPPAPTSPVFATLHDNRLNKGIVTKPWIAAADRDNRGKVYLYFSPEDMTVAFENMQGIGWQGVPDYLEGIKWKEERQSVINPQTFQKEAIGPVHMVMNIVMRQPLKELGKGFYQRVFTSKMRIDPVTKKSGPVLVGSVPHDFLLRLKDEDDHAHVEASGRSFRAHLKVAVWPPKAKDKPAVQRDGVRSITGETLAKPVPANLRGGAEIDLKDVPKTSSHASIKPANRGPVESVSPNDAVVAITSGTGLLTWIELRPDPNGYKSYPQTEEDLTRDLKRLTDLYNEEKNLTVELDKCSIIDATRYPDGRIMATIKESPNKARQRWQKEVSAKSFHSAIIGNPDNHRQVTAYDVAIGRGEAPTDPKFYAYLCAVADWRLKILKGNEKPREGILDWAKFEKNFGVYWNTEPAWRKDLIYGNATYYTSGILPKDLPLPTGKLWDIVISETTSGSRVKPTKEKP